MFTLAPVARIVAMLLALLLPTVALAEGQGERTAGGLTSAWPLGLIVLLVALVAVVGTLLTRRGRASGPPPHRS